MRDQRAFMPSGKTFVVASASTAPTGVQVKPLGGTTDFLAGCQYRIHNAGNALCHVAWASVDSDAANAAVASTAGTPTAALPVPSTAVVIITAPANSYFSSNSAVNCTVYITPGQGL
jgi:hypothetical protein